MCAIHGPGVDRLGDLGDRTVRHAEQDELGLVLSQHETALAQPSCDSGSHSAGADDSDVLEQKSSSSVADTGQLAVYRPSIE